MSPFSRTAILAAILALTPLPLPDSAPLDVTAKISSQLQNDSLSLPVDSQSLTNSPSTGDPQKLKIEYTQGTDSHTRVFADSQTALIPALPNQKLTILKATYGPMPDPVNVTPKLQQALKISTSPDFNFTPDDTSLAIDPSPGSDKILIARYSIDGTQHLTLTNQNETFHLVKPASAKSLQILQASYGLAPSSLDVTEIVASNIHANHLTIGASNDTFADPSEGDTKQLLIRYTVNGTPHSAFTEEYKDQLHLPLLSDGPGTLRITSARYGVALDPPK